MFQWLPISRLSQLVFAESFSQALIADIPQMEALSLAASISPGYRWRMKLFEMTKDVRSNGYSLEQALKKTRARVRPGLLEALRVGQERGVLAQELHAFAQSLHRHATRRTARALWRSHAAMRFAQVLCRQLQHERLTPSLIADAGRIAAAGNRRFICVMQKVHDDLENQGASFGEAIKRFPRHFDLLFSQMVDASTDRQSLRRILSLLSGTSEANEVARISHKIAAH